MDAPPGGVREGRADCMRRDRNLNEYEAGVDTGGSSHSRAPIFAWCDEICDCEAKPSSVLRTSVARNSTNANGLRDRVSRLEHCIGAVVPDDTPRRVEKVVRLVFGAGRLVLHPPGDETRVPTGSASGELARRSRSRALLVGPVHADHAADVALVSLTALGLGFGGRHLVDRDGDRKRMPIASPTVMSSTSVNPGSLRCRPPIPGKS